MVTAFLGLNRTNTAKDSSSMEMNEEKNLSSRAYPYLACTTPKAIVKACDSNTTFTIIDKDGHPLLIHNIGTTVHVWDMVTHEDISTYSVTAGKKTFVKMGARVIIHPDMVEYDSVMNSWARMSVSETYGELWRHISINACDKEGNFFKTYLSSNPPASGDDSSYLVDGDNVYVWATDKWVQTDEYYLKLTCEYAPFRKFQTISAETEDTSFTINEGVIYDRTDKVTVNQQQETNSNTELIVKGHMNIEQTTGSYEPPQDVTIVITSSTPQMDYICESGNRLWGCRYGDNLNEIYASALGDASVWGLFEDTSMDSYIASIGEDGKWTGCIEYNGHPMFFKDHMIYTIYGMYPAQYQISKQEGLGMKEGNTACVFNNVLYYGSHEGICAYTGSVPRVISHDCGEIDANALAGAGHRLYVSDGGDVYTLDTEYNVWHHEDDTEVSHAFSYGDKVYFNSNGNIVSTDVGSGQIAWEAITPKLNIRNPDSSYLAEIQIRTEFVNGHSLKVYVSYDEGSYNDQYHVTGGVNRWRDVINRHWEDVADLTWDQLAGTKQGVFPYVVHVRLKRASTCRIKLVGVGDIRIISLTKHWRTGSDSTWR